MNEHDQSLAARHKHLEMSAAIVAADGMEITPQVEQLLAPLLSGQMTLKQHEAWLLQQLQEMPNAG